MIEFFYSIENANDWLGKHPDMRVVAICPGQMSGSLFVAVEAVPVFSPSIELTEDMELVPTLKPIPPSAALVTQKRRGRPPKVKSA